MHCKHCKRLIDKTMKFCPGCGEEIVFVTEVEGDFVTITFLKEDLDYQIKTELDFIVKAIADQKDLVIDFSGVGFIDSLIIGTFVNFTKMSKQRSMYFVNLNARMVNTLKSMRLDQIINIIDEEQLMALKKESGSK